MTLSVEEDRADSHDRRALLDRRLEILARAHRERLKTALACELGEAREVRAAEPRILGERRHRHQPRDFDGRTGDEGVELAGGDSGLSLLAADVDLDQDPQALGRVAA